MARYPYRKPSDRNQYVLPDSCHPMECIKSIPYNLCTRILRVFSEPSERVDNFEKLKEILMARNYPPGILDAAIARVKVIPREQALKCVMVSQKKYLEEVFPEAPLVAFRRQTNIREKIIRAKVAPQRNTRDETNFKWNEKVCKVCGVQFY